MRALARQMYDQVQAVYWYFQLIFGTVSFRHDPHPSQENINIGNALFQLFKKKTMTQKEMAAKAQEILRQCSSGDLDTLQYVADENGFNILQHAILLRNVHLLKLFIDSKCDINKGKCSLPLHLACKMGDVECVKFLLSHGAQVDVYSGMCYPRPHFPIRHVPSRFHFMERDIYPCDHNLELPLMYAIQNDHVEVAKVLLSHSSRWSMTQWLTHKYPLHYACMLGAYECMKYIAEFQNFSDLNIADDQGMTPLMHAVTWGKKYTQYLVEVGADIHAINSRQETALHVLYTQLKDPADILNTTQYLLGVGLEQHINKADSLSNTALHHLITLVNKRVSAFTFKAATGDSDNGAQVEETQTEFDHQVMSCIEMLLNFNADPNQVNSVGIGPLHKAFFIFGFVASNDPTGVILEEMPCRENYKLDINNLLKITQILLNQGVDSNGATVTGRSPLFILLQGIVNSDPAKWLLYTNELLSCIKLLCDHGANPSFSLQTHINMVSVLGKFGHCTLTEEKEHLKLHMVDFVSNLIELLLKHGLNPNYCTNQREPHLEGGRGNMLVELVRLVHYIRDPVDMNHVHRWLLTCLQWGANPDIEPYPSDPIICHSQSSIYLKPKSTQAVNHYMYEIQDLNTLLESGRARHMLSLFYHSMDHDALFQCLNSAKIMSRFNPNKQPSSKFIKMLNSLSCRPRSLQQISRIAIYKAIDRQLILKVPQLPLPNPMKRYLLNVE